MNFWVVNIGLSEFSMDDMIMARIKYFYGESSKYFFIIHVASLYIYCFFKLMKIMITREILEKLVLLFLYDTLPNIFARHTL